HDADPPTDGINWGPNHWRIGSYEQGTTEPGSSGSPLFDQNHRIVGQLHGGTASCTSLTYDEYGKVAASWDGGGATSSRLSNWLDPGSSGAVTMNGVDWSTCAFNPVGAVALSRSIYACTDPLTITMSDDNLDGTTPAPNPALVTSHGYQVTGLAACSPYVYSVSSTDGAGNATSNNNGGAYYSFTTGTNTTPTYAYSGPPVSIPDNNPTGASAAI